MVILVPTLNRPHKLRELLESVAMQTEAVRRIIIVDGAEDAKPVVDLFQPSLPLEYSQCHPPSQIRQRNHGLSQLRAENDHLVALLDDDIVLGTTAVEEMIAFWNRTPKETAGVAFNIVNGESERYTRLKGLLGLCAPEPGRVLRTGMATAVTHAKSDARVQWLPGGATVWRSDVLLGRPHAEVSTRWAIAEDLLFSYPIGKKRPLFVNEIKPFGIPLSQINQTQSFDFKARRLDALNNRPNVIIADGVWLNNSERTLHAEIIAGLLVNHFLQRGAYPLSEAFHDLAKNRFRRTNTIFRQCRQRIVDQIQHINKVSLLWLHINQPSRKLTSAAGLI